MTLATAPAQDLVQDFEAFERENPNVADAMRLLGVSLREYDQAVAAMQGTAVFFDSGSTAGTIVALYDRLG
jgi:hypothetical protein